MFNENLSILVPFKSDNGYRDKNWSWIKKRYDTLMPNAQICMGDCDIEPFSRSQAINNAAKLATRDIFVIADADIVVDIKQIELAVTGLSLYPWIVPYMIINKLTVKQTDELLQKDPSITMSDIDFGDCEKLIGQNENRIIAGGIIIVPRKYFEQIGGFDERFKGWGGEDDAFQRALDVSCGPHGRLKTTLWHLYHPLSPKTNHEKNCELLNKFYGTRESIINNFNKKNNVTS